MLLINLPPENNYDNRPKYEYLETQKENKDSPHIEREKSSILTATGSVISY